MKTLYKKSMFLLYALLVFFVPLIFVTFTQESFELPKMFFVYTIGTLIIVLYLVYRLLGFIKTSFAANLTKFFFVIPFVSVYIISTMYSSDFYTSLWGYYTRFNGGLVSVLLFAALSYIAFVTLKKDDFISLFVLSLFSVTLISLYGVVQHYGLFGQIVLDRVYSTFGQPNWLAQYLIIFLPLVIFLYGTNKFHFSPLVSGFLLLAYTLMFWCLWLSFSLSGLLGLVFSLPFLPRGNVRKYLLLGLVSLLVVSTNFSFFGNRAHDAYIDIKNFISESFVAYAADEYLVSDPGFIRKELWKSSLSLFAASPKNVLLGIGPQTFPYEFQAFRSPNLNYSSEWDYVINRPHNYYIEVLVELGVFGLLAYIYLISTLFKKSPDYLKASLVGFYVTNIFGWPVVATSLVFWLLISYSILNNFSSDS